MESPERVSRGKAKKNIWKNNSWKFSKLVKTQSKDQLTPCIKIWRKTTRYIMLKVLKTRDRDNILFPLNRKTTIYTKEQRQDSKYLICNNWSKNTMKQHHQYAERKIISQNSKNMNIPLKNKGKIKMFSDIQKWRESIIRGSSLHDMLKEVL